MQDLSVPVWVVVAVAAGLLVVLAVLLVATLRARRRVARNLDAARVEAEALRAQVEEIQHRLEERPAVRDEREYVITGLGGGFETGASAPSSTTGDVPTVPAPLFADMVLRESVVQAAGLAAGLRRALSPQSRNRIWFEMRREVKRARKQRRADLREARREWEARQRSRVTLDDDAAEGSAA
jgi:hypothetical protein